MKEKALMSQLHRFILHPLTAKLFLPILACTYILYLMMYMNFFPAFPVTPLGTIRDHRVTTALDDSIKHWTRTAMQNATDESIPSISAHSQTQGSTPQNVSRAAKQKGQLPSNKNLTYPLSTVGKVFFTTASGQDAMCSGTAIVSRNHSTVDTAGHCLYMYGEWVHNLVFCPLYEHGNTPYGCWAARDLEVPADWINARPNDFHHDFGMAIVAPNSQGDLTTLVGGAGWAYNQPADQPFYAYGYPAAYPFDGETIQSCTSSSGTIWPFGGGNVVSIPCNMTGGSSGGPWFINSNGTQYVNGHNDFISSIMRGHMFSPYYDDTWYALYNKAQQA